MGLSNEFQCVDGIEHPGIVPEVICSPDGEVVVAFFETLRGSIQLIGPTWAGTPKRFRDGVPTPLLPSNVMNVTVEDGIEIPQGRDWELLLMGISKLADYPVEERCLRSWATEHGLPSSTNSTGEKFDRYKAQLDFHFSSISFERGRNLQEFLGIQEPAAGLGTSLGDGR